MAHGILILRPGVEILQVELPSKEVQSLDHWGTREVPIINCL